MRGSAISWNHGQPCGLQPGTRNHYQRTTWMSTSWAHICVCSTRNKLYLLHAIDVAAQHQKRR
eukprot:COSAG01_NODE_2346_length_7859_cov_60.187500_5_plen_63_part_00